MDGFASSPTGAQRPRSKYSYKDLIQMSKHKTDCPLRVIAHIDLDAFYAQCEMVRLGVPEDQPLAVQQWDALIAVNYPARVFEINRMRNVKEAKEKCPNLMAVHVATWRIEDDKVVQGYQEIERNPSILNEKVSLDQYRRESKKILKIFREMCSRVEKASVDESFLDLGGLVYQRLVNRYPDELGVVDGEVVPPYGDTTEKLRLPEIAGVEWGESHLIDLDGGDTAEEDDVDWDDVIMGIAGEIVKEIRSAVRERLGYTCSGGIARNKMLAKLGSGYKKPNQQTIIRNRAVAHFLSGLKFTDIRNLGGKLGDKVAKLYNTEKIADILPNPLETFKSALGPDVGTWLFKTIRGIDTSEVIIRTEIKSMLSAKSFNPYINKASEADRWLRIFCADLSMRVNEGGDDGDLIDDTGSQPVVLRRPRTLTLHHRHGGTMRSRQMPIPLGKTFEEDMLLPLAKTLLKQIEQEGRCWPCGNLSLSVGGFEDVGRGSNRGIGTWLVRGEEAKMVKEESLKRAREAAESKPQPQKKRKMGIESFFAKDRASKEDEFRFDPEDVTLGEDHFDETAFLHSEEEFHVPINSEEDLYSDMFKDAHTEQPRSLNRGRQSSEGKSLDSKKGPPTLRNSSSGRLKFFSKEDSAGTSSRPSTAAGSIASPESVTSPPEIEEKLESKEEQQEQEAEEEESEEEDEPEPEEQLVLEYPCPRCNNKMVPLAEVEEHSDWHFAKDLMNEDRAQQSHAVANLPPTAPIPEPRVSAGTSSGAKRGRKPKKGKEPEKEEEKPASQPVAKRGRGRPPKAALPVGDKASLEKGQKTLAFGHRFAF